MIDEAQDFYASWFDVLRSTLKDEKSAHIWIFMDEQQQIYGADFAPPEKF